jgi:hypothetical protein
MSVSFNVLFSNFHGYFGTINIRFKVRETKKNAVFWDVVPCGSCKSRRFGGKQIASIIRVTRIGAVGKTLAVTSNRSTMRTNSMSERKH